MRPTRRAGGWVALALLVWGCGGEAEAPTPTPAAGPTTTVAAASAPAVEPSVGCHGGELPAARGLEGTITVNGERRGYVLDAPATGADRPLPLVLAFHGFRGNARRLRSWAAWPRIAGRRGIIVVHPDGRQGVEVLGQTGRGWDSQPGQTTDLEFVEALLDQLERERCVDRRRIYATGLSSGGIFAGVLGCELNERLAAVAPVAGTMPLPGCGPVRPVPILMLHGSADRLLRVDQARAGRDWWSRRAGCGGALLRDGCEQYLGCATDVVYCEGGHGHWWPRGATQRIWRFFQAHPRT
jgi:polyhydroxybutyrate depolymerase